jgi:hypothetical protein
MNRIALVIGSMLLAVSAQAADLPAWFNAGASNQANAVAALRAKDGAGNAAATLVRMGGDPVESVRSVVEVYNSCPALYDAVREGVRAAPAKAGEIAAGVAKLSNCPCSGDNVWARSRLEHRLRTTRAVADNVPLGFTCTCTAATAEAAVSAVPDQADAILRALTSTGDCQCAASAFAGIANALGPGAPSREFIEKERAAAQKALAGGAGAPKPALVDVGLMCPNEIAGLATQFNEAPIPLAPPQVATADGEPRSDDSVIDPNRGGELASPN